MFREGGRGLDQRHLVQGARQDLRMEWTCSVRRGKHQLHPDRLLAGQLVTVERFPETGSLQGRWGLNNGRASIEVD